MCGNTGRSLGSGTLVVRSRRCGGSRGLPPSAAANHRQLRSLPSLAPASLHRVRGPLSPLQTAEAVAGGAKLSMDKCVDDYSMGGVMMFDARTGRGLVGESLLFYYYICIFFSRGLGLEQDCDAGSDEGQLDVVPAPVAATSVAVTTEEKGASQDPWSKFCASREIASATAAKDVVG
jgi:hypothetical protein